MELRTRRQWCKTLGKDYRLKADAKPRGKHENGGNLYSQDDFCLASEQAGLAPVTDLNENATVNSFRNILIDIEFTGLDNTFIKDNEIVQVKLMDADSGVGVCINYKASKPVSLYHQINEGLDGKYKGRTNFSAESFAKALKKLGVGQDENVRYFGYSVSMDHAMLEKYGVKIAITDLQELVRRNPKYELALATGCASMEAAYLLLTGKNPHFKTHLNLRELSLIREIYQQTINVKCLNKHYTLMPYGHCAGMPIKQYVMEFRRAADGYRFNNNDLLAESLTANIQQSVPTSWGDDEEFDYDDDEFDHEDTPDW